MATQVLKNIRIPQKITSVCTIIDGADTIGTCKEVVLPKIEEQMQDVKGFGFQRKIPTGIFNALEAEFSFLNFSAVGALLGVSWEENPLIVKATINFPKVVPIFARLKGYIMFPGFSNLASEADVEVKVKMHVDFYSLVIGGVPVVEIDTQEGVFNVGPTNKAPWAKEMFKN